jgi:AraC-like DNA-binding protein
MSALPLSVAARSPGPGGGQAMYQIYRPQPPLSSFVEYFWLHEGAAQPPARVQALPTGTPELVIDLGGEGLRVVDPRDPRRCQRFQESVLHGAQAGFFVIETDRALVRLGVQFRPGGGYPFFAPPAGELRDRHVTLDALWGARAFELRERLLEAEAPEARFHLLERALLAQAVRPLERRPAVAFALRQFRAAPQARAIARVADQVALSHCRFIQVFRDEVGLTPKQFCRIRRFVKVLRRTRKGEGVAWAELALACGYYDHAHLANDFRALAGMRPSAYLQDRDARFIDYVPLIH